MSRRLKMIIAYDGAAFSGWQSQSHRNTIQDHLEHAFERVTGKLVRVHGAGRTDAGVHALAQCAHVDLTVLRKATKHFAGTHDFAGFAANRGKSAGRTDSSGGEAEESTIRTIYSVRVRQKGPCVTIEFDGDGFLYKMVRLIVGSLLKCALGKMRIEDATARPGPAEVGSARFTAPAEGLFLVRVRY